MYASNKNHPSNTDLTNSAVNHKINLTAFGTMESKFEDVMNDITMPTAVSVFASAIVVRLLDGTTKTLRFNDPDWCITGCNNVIIEYMSDPAANMEINADFLGISSHGRYMIIFLSKDRYVQYQRKNRKVRISCTVIVRRGVFEITTDYMPGKFIPIVEDDLQSIDKRMYPVAVRYIDAELGPGIMMHIHPNDNGVFLLPKQ
jgi:hypothetical protein